jgi:hypothetical protein
MTRPHPLPRALRYRPRTVTPPPPRPPGDPAMTDTRCPVWLGHDDDEGGSHRCARRAEHLGAHDARPSASGS